MCLRARARAFDLASRDKGSQAEVDVDPNNVQVIQSVPGSALAAHVLLQFVLHREGPR